MFNFLYSKILNFLGPLRSGDYFKFVFGILKNLYLYMAAAGVYVVYYLFKALKNAGILDAFQNILDNTMQSIMIISHDCFPLISNLQSMLECIKAS
jgi:hypothetical protein